MKQELAENNLLDLMSFIHIAIHYDDLVNRNIDDAKKEELKKIAHAKITHQLKPHHHNPLLISRERVEEIKVATGKVLDKALEKVLTTNDYSEVHVLGGIYNVLEMLQYEKPKLTDEGRKALEDVHKRQMRIFLKKKTGGKYGPIIDIDQYIGRFGLKKISVKTKKHGNDQIKLPKSRGSTQNYSNNRGSTRRKKTNGVAPTTSFNPQRMGRKGRRIQVDARKSGRSLQKNAR